VDSRVHAALPVAVCAVLLATAVAAAVEFLALAADGSFYLVRVLGTDGVFGPDSRTLANAVRQAPVLLAARGGVEDTSLLAVLHGLGQIVLPALVWSAAILLARAEAVVVTAVSTTAVICFGTALFFNVSESVLAVALTALVSVLLWRRAEWGSAHAVLAVAAAVVLVASYESTAVTGLALAGWAAWRATVSTSPTGVASSAAVALLSATSVPVAISGWTTNSGAVSAESSLHSIASLEPAAFYVALLGGAGVVAVATLPLPGRARVALVPLFGALAVLAVLDLPATSLSSFRARGGTAAAGLLLTLYLAAAWASRLRAQPSAETNGNWILAVPVALAVAMAATTLPGADRWSRDLDAFRAEVDRARGLTSVDVLPPHRRSVVWGWTSPSLSLLVRRSPRSGLLVDRDPSYVPFSPSTARKQLSDEYRWR
jgi:hypothetical protein